MNEPQFERPWWTRRGFLQGTAAVAAGIYGLPARLGHAAEIPDQFDGSKFQLAAPEPNPKSGGVLRVGFLMRPPHFDIHQSGTFGTLGRDGPMFNNLIRHDPRDSGKTIIPDLAHSWEISKDGKTYTFLLRKGVQFHDGAELTAEDVKATFDRIAKPPSGISIPRSILFRAVSEINAKDPYTIEFKLAEPRPKTFIMLALASGWNVIVRKKTLEDNNYNLRKLTTYPGTGPFRTVRYVENEVRVVEKNPNYWNKGLPYLDGIEFYNLIPFSPELGSRVGYQTDTAAALKEARALLAAAGHANGIQGLDFMVRDVASFKLWAQAIQAMLQEGLNVQCNLRTVVESVWFDDTASGHYDLAIGAVVSTLLDPSDYFNAWYRTGGPQNYSFWNNEKFNALVDQIDREVDPAKRLALVRQTEAIMEEDPPVLPVAWEKINDVWYNYVKGHNPTTISASTTSCAKTRSGWTRRDTNRPRHC